MVNMQWLPQIFFILLPLIAYLCYLGDIMWLEYISLAILVYWLLLVVPIVFLKIFDWHKANKSNTFLNKACHLGVDIFLLLFGGMFFSLGIVIVLWFVYQFISSIPIMHWYL